MKIISKSLNEVRKEDDYYYYFCGPFWIISNSFSNILSGNFSIESTKYLCDYNGTIINDNLNKSQKTHQKIWDDQLKSKYHNDDYTYYPRGRVSIYQGQAYIYINSKCNLPKVIDSIINEYNISNLEIIIDLNDTYQGHHYDFKLK